ncbi:aldo/keto reductase [Promicromonospora sukumoe]|uniref:Diketogulonate reductase-like aldo/keto reductase n=1 Tax=Promicromonospora sukumoe TaxID=88382 RepID=A0A7W3PBV4_9MICO|nr:aldo/keto reductase [Promicromonospora sukumoe]MBA8806250.1 diketogulonate reductase-like aldo/keto reductase [Promicromonospora sukumoe]
MSIPTVATPSGYTLPAVGFGTYRLRGESGARAVGDALDAGYRLLDSAASYQNEGAVGAAVRRSDVPREEIVVTSKLPGKYQAFDDAIQTVEESVLRTGLDAVDLYLIHWPNPSVGRYVEAWRALIEARERGLVRQIGVCNFLSEHLDRLAQETGELPAVNQIELHPYFPQTEALAFHREHGILTESWSPIGRGNDLLDHPVITEIAKEHGVSAAQTVLAWHVACGAIPLPKAAGHDRQRENLAIFEVGLTDDEIARITALGRPDGRTAGQDPATYEEL